MVDKTKEHDIGLAELDKRQKNLTALWYNDGIENAHGLRTSVKIDNVLCHYRSEFQEIAVFETESLGRMLVIDGITMLTEFDEYAYHEMIAHVPVLTHPAPSKILVIGGGDGGTVREILKHPEVEEIHVCELDREVVTICQKYLPSIASSFDNHKVKIFYEDGAKFVSKHKGYYDVIIVDSTDPVGPGKILFQKPFYSDMKNALSDNGIVVTQCESIYLHKDIIRGVSSFAAELFPLIAYYYTLVPTYPSGIIGFLFCSLKWDPVKDLSMERSEKIKGLKYYTAKLQKASFILPRFGEELIHAV